MGFIPNRGHGVTVGAFLGWLLVAALLIVASVAVLEASELGVRSAGIGAPVGTGSVGSGSADVAFRPDRGIPADFDDAGCGSVLTRGSYPVARARWSNKTAHDVKIEYSWSAHVNSPTGSAPGSYTTILDYASTFDTHGVASAIVPYMAFPGDEITVRVSLDPEGAGAPYVADTEVFTVGAMESVVPVTAAPTPRRGNVWTVNYYTEWLTETLIDADFITAAHFDTVDVSIFMHNVLETTEQNPAYDEFFVDFVNEIRDDYHAGFLPLVYLFVHGAHYTWEGTGWYYGGIWDAMVAADAFLEDTGGTVLHGCPSFTSTRLYDLTQPGAVDSLVNRYVERMVRTGYYRLPWVGAFLDYLDSDYADWQCNGYPGRGGSACGDLASTYPCGDYADFDRDGTAYSSDAGDQTAYDNATALFVITLRAVMDHVRGDETFIIVNNGDIVRNGGSTALIDGEMYETTGNSDPNNWAEWKQAMGDETTGLQTTMSSARLDPPLIMFAGKNAQNPMREVMALMGGAAVVYYDITRGDVLPEGCGSWDNPCAYAQPGYRLTLGPPIWPVDGAYFSATGDTVRRRFANNIEAAMVLEGSHPWTFRVFDYVTDETITTPTHPIQGSVSWENEW